MDPPFRPNSRRPGLSGTVAIDVIPEADRPYPRCRSALWAGATQCQPRAVETLAGPARTTAVTLRDGWIVELRRADVNDEGAVLELLRSLSVHSRAMRFATSAVHLPSAARAAVEHPGVIAFAPARRCVGHTWYVRTTERRAEVAVVVADRYQRRGLGTILLRQLAEIAASCGIDVLEAYVLFENVRMTDLLRDCGIPLRRAMTAADSDSSSISRRRAPA